MHECSIEERSDDVMVSHDEYRDRRQARFAVEKSLSSPQGGTLRLTASKSTRFVSRLHLERSF